MNCVFFGGGALGQKNYFRSPLGESSSLTFVIDFSRMAVIALRLPQQRYW